MDSLESVHTPCTLMEQNVTIPGSPCAQAKPGLPVVSLAASHHITDDQLYRWLVNTSPVLRDRSL